MSTRRNRMACGVAALVAALLGTGTASGAGFSIFEQGSKAMGMAGAFTAQADDGSAMFHNPGGLAFQDQERAFSLGLTYIRGLDATFDGAAGSFPGAGVSEEQETLAEVPPHAYWVQPIQGSRFTFGLAVNAPFGLTTEWKDPDTFSGRFLSTKAALRAIDINPVIGWRVTDRLGIGFGPILRVSDVELIQHVPRFNPFSQTVADIATLELQSDFDNGLGFNVGVLHKYNESFSWGFNYRSKIEIDYGGDAVLSQNLTGTPLDPIVAGLLPFGRELGVETSLEFPDEASLGFAFALTESLLLETDFNWTGWSTFDVLVIDFTGNELPDAVRPQHWDDAYNYRAGLRWDTAPGRQWRFGYVFDETPQPEEAVSPLLPDADRNGFTIGYGWQGASTTCDVALMYLMFDERTRAKNFDGEAASTYFGSYQNEAVLLGFTLGF